MNRILVVVTCALASGATAGAQTMRPVPVVLDSAALRRVLAVELAIEAAVEARDRRALDTLYALDFKWVHWDGSTDTRGTWFAFLDSVQYRTHRASSEQIALFVNSAIVSGVLASRGRYVRTSREFDFELDYARIYVYDPALRRWTLRDQLSRRPAPGAEVIGPR